MFENIQIFRIFFIQKIPGNINLKKHKNENPKKIWILMNTYILQQKTT